MLATHSSRTGIFSPATDASKAVQNVAENGNATLLVAALAGDVHVYDFVVGTAPLTPDSNPGGVPFESSATFCTALLASGGLYDFTDSFSLGLSGDWGDNSSAYALNGRFYFGQ